MPDFYVNNKPQPNGDHEVHSEGCLYMPLDRTHVGSHSNCGSAVSQARRLYPTANGCVWCARACHAA